MDRLKNLKKKLNNWVDVTLAELCSAYIKQLAKQTSKKRDNSFLKEYSLNHLATEHRSTTIVTSSQDISEKITMEMTTDEMCSYLREWAIDDAKILAFEDHVGPQRAPKVEVYSKANKLLKTICDW